MTTATFQFDDPRAATLREDLFRSALAVACHALPDELQQWTAEQMHAGATLRLVVTIPTGDIDAALVRDNTERWLFRVTSATSGNA
jgi:hypothetical protein